MDCNPLREWLEMSATSFNPLLGFKGKEGYLLTSNSAVVVAGMPCVPSWTQYWFVLRDSYLALYDNSREPDPAQVVLFDASTRVYSGAVLPVADCGGGMCMPGGGGGDSKSITIMTAQGRVVLQAPSKKEAEDWVLALRAGVAACEYAQPKALSSFAPQRQGGQLRWLVDARNTYAAVVDALQQAKHEILITGWWVTGEMGLIREEESEAARALGVAVPGAHGGETESPRGARHVGERRIGNKLLHHRHGGREGGRVTHTGQGPAQSASAVGGASSGLPRPQVDVTAEAADAEPAAAAGVVTSSGTTLTLPSSVSAGGGDGVAAGSSSAHRHDRAFARLLDRQQRRGPFLRESGSPRSGQQPGPEYDAADQPAGEADTTAAAGVRADAKAPLFKRRHPGFVEAALSSAAEGAQFLTDQQLLGLQQMALVAILRDRAEAGVKVYVQMYREIPATLALMSRYQKHVLATAHPNIYVIRHGSWFWTHHEKIVVVDRGRGFCGGLDLAWGRWDTGAHLVSDDERRYRTLRWPRLHCS
jgi:hypothetical protein